MESVVIHRKKPSSNRKKVANQLLIEGEIPLEFDDDGKFLISSKLQRNLSAPQMKFPPMYSGLLGYLGYDIVREIEDLPPPANDDLQVPDAILSIIGEVAAFDHWSQRVFLIANAIVKPQSSESEIKETYYETKSRLDSLMLDGAKPLSEPLLDPDLKIDLVEVKPTISENDYCEIVEKAKITFSMVIFFR